jgi:uncharacterized membrane protein
MAGPGTGSRELERVTAFTDAAVAIALTLLVLPLVDVAHEGSRTPLDELWREHVGDVLAFLLSFFVVARFWRAHRRIFETMDRVDDGLLTLNTLWLLGVVFLPVPTAVLTFEGDASHAVVVLYTANLCFVSVLGTSLSWWVATHPALQRHGLTPVVTGHLRQGAVMAVSFAVVTGLAVLFGSWALLVLVALPLVSGVAHRVFRP